MKNKTIFVDFFDTIMFRHIHPLQVTRRWAENICRKYRLQESAEELMACRRECFRKAHALKNEAIYADSVLLMWEAIEKRNPKLKDVCTRDAFLEFVKETELALEIAVQYPNRKLLHQLQKSKEKGARIYIVSDFYFGKTELIHFCKAKDIDISLFDEVFVSADLDATKSSGKIYEKILKILDCRDGQILMIGDNAHSDAKMARLNGIRPVLRRRVWYKGCLHLKRVMGYDFSAHAGKRIVQKCYKGAVPFAEYIAIFFSFTERLRANIDKNEKIVFLSREGYFLKRLFELYEYYVDAQDEQTDTAYFLCSRRAITSVQMDKLNDLRDTVKVSLKDYLYSAGIPFDEMPDILKHYGVDVALLDSLIQEIPQELVHRITSEQVQKNQEALQHYTKEIIGQEAMEKTINLIDIGWYGSMQIGLEKILGIKTKGFYLGTVGEETNPPRKGLIFSAAEHKKRHTYFDVLRANIQLYELLAAAPHGSAQTYILTEQGITVPMAWVDAEKKLYDSVIKPWQDRALIDFAALAAWKPVDREMFSNKHSRNIVMRSGLLADKKRLDFIKALDEGFVWNFVKDTVGTKYDYKSVRINFSVITSPEKYVRYAVKFQRYLPRNMAVQLTYKLVARAFSGFVKFVLFIKGAA